MQLNKGQGQNDDHNQHDHVCGLQSGDNELCGNSVVHSHCRHDCGFPDKVKERHGSVRNMLRKRIVFYGWVQGVGFRYRTMIAANQHGTTGWVRNDPGDTVTMEIQGTNEQIDQVLMALEHGRFISIDRMDVSTIPVIEGERGFRAY